MSRKGERNQNQQQGKLAKAYGGYLPSVEGTQHPDVPHWDGEQDPDHKGPLLQRPGTGRDEPH